MTRISIAMATYNGAQHLQAQLDSFVAQTRHPDELVVTDDGSSDGTIDILAEFAERAPFAVKVHRNEHRLGWGQNFNRALLHTTGDLVFISDQDDVWFPEKIERMTAAALRNPRHYLFMHDAAITDADLHPSGDTLLGQRRALGQPDAGFPNGCCITVTRGLLNLCLPMPKGYPAHDVWLTVIAEALTRRHLLPDVLQYYRRHNSAVNGGSVARSDGLTRWRWLTGEAHRHWRARQARLQGRPTSGEPAMATEELNQMRLMRMWAAGAATRAPADDRSALLALSESLQRREEVLWERQRIWSEAIWRRGAPVARLWRNGGYALYAGWRSALRDLLT